MSCIAAYIQINQERSLSFIIGITFLLFLQPHAQDLSLGAKGEVLEKRWSFLDVRDG